MYVAVLTLTLGHRHFITIVGIHRVRTNAALLYFNHNPNPNLDIWPSHRQELYAAHAVLELVLGIRLINSIIYWCSLFYPLISVALAAFCQPFNKRILYVSSIGYFKVMSFRIPSLNTLGSFVSELCCGQTDRQTDRQTDSKILPTTTDRHSRRG